MIYKEVNLNERLKTVASFVDKKIELCIDVGTDHGYLPIYLVQKDLCERAIASDINSGPLLITEQSLRNFGLSKRISTVKTNGLDGFENENPDYIFICGMGGELIFDIIKEAKFVKEQRLNLVLQPMTMHDVLREQLLKNGFSIIDEKLCIDSGKTYTIMKVVFTDVVDAYTLSELHLGRENIKKGGELFIKFAKSKLEHYETILNNKKNAFVDYSLEQQLCCEIRELLKGEI